MTTQQILNGNENRKHPSSSGPTIHLPKIQFHTFNVFNPLLVSLHPEIPLQGRAIRRGACLEAAASQQQVICVCTHPCCIVVVQRCLNSDTLNISPLSVQRSALSKLEFLA
jgi:hypothetical protein